jgi:hypothetical protein
MHTPCSRTSQATTAWSSSQPEEQQGDSCRSPTLQSLHVFQKSRRYVAFPHYCRGIVGGLCMHLLLATSNYKPTSWWHCGWPFVCIFYLPLQLPSPQAGGTVGGPLKTKMSTTHHLGSRKQQRIVDPRFMATASSETSMYMHMQLTSPACSISQPSTGWNGSCFQHQCHEVALDRRRDAAICYNILSARLMKV